jgi:hypothetical protein
MGYFFEREIGEKGGISFCHKRRKEEEEERGA